MLALLAITQNYGEFAKTNYATNTESFSNHFFASQQSSADSDDQEKDKVLVSNRSQALNPSKGFRKSNSYKRVRRMF